jgi:LPXTG-motif cell wall-anchored protein
MRLKRRVASGIAAGAIAMTMLFAGGPAHAATNCGTEPTATQFPAAGGGLDIAAYAAAVAAFNACVSGGTAATTTTVPASHLAFTGSNSSNLGAIGAALVGVGAGAVVLSRRRRHVSTATGDSVE